MSIYWEQISNVLFAQVRSEEDELQKAYLSKHVLPLFKEFNQGWYMLALFTNKISYSEIAIGNAAVSLLENPRKIKSISLKLQPESIWFHQFFDKDKPSCVTFSTELRISKRSEHLGYSSELIDKGLEMMLDTTMDFLFHELFSGDNFLDEGDKIFSFNNSERRESLKKCLEELKRTMK